MVVTTFADDNKKYLSTDYAKEEPMKDGYLWRAGGADRASSSIPARDGDGRRDLAFDKGGQCA